METNNDTCMWCEDQFDGCIYIQYDKQFCSGDCLNKYSRLQYETVVMDNGNE